QPHCAAREDAGVIGARFGGTTRSDRAVVRSGGGPDHGQRLFGWHFLFARSVAWRTTGSQHSVLEVAASFRSHHGALQGHHPNHVPPTLFVRVDGAYATPHVVADKPGAGWKQHEYRSALEPGLVDP